MGGCIGHSIAHVVQQQRWKSLWLQKMGMNNFAQDHDLVLPITLKYWPAMSELLETKQAAKNPRSDPVG